MFDAKRFLRDNWPSPADLYGWLLSFDPESGLKAPAVYMWYSRGSIPGDWLVRILAYAELVRGKPISLLPWLTV